MTFPATIGDGVRQLSLSFAKNPGAVPTAALIQSSFDHPPEVWAGPLNHLEQITNLNSSLRPDWGKSESLTWNNEGFRVQGWLIYPKNYDPQKKYPLIRVGPWWPGESNIAALAFRRLQPGRIFNPWIISC